MKICIVVGTRPEIIKMAPIIRECQKRNLEFVLIHTNQHYSYEMDRIFFEELELPEPNFNLEVGSGSHGAQTGKMLIELEKTIQEEEPDMVLVEGDTNTVLAAALTATKLLVDVGHVEAGLRSFDRTMPEEFNRVLTDHMSKFLFAPTQTSKDNMVREGIEEDWIFVVGNTIVDATLHNITLSSSKTQIMDDLGILNSDYFLLTLHRQENVDDRVRLEKIIESLEAVVDKFSLPMVYPIHPRSKKMLNKFELMQRLESIPNTRIIDPVGYLEFLALEKNAKLILTDSGGVQEEACILNVPCVTLRYNTERPETVEVGKNVVAGVDKNVVLKGVEDMIDAKMPSENPFGDGTSGKKIIDIIIGL